MTKNRLLKALLLCPLFMLFMNAAWAQNKTITGKVTDEKGAAISGVSVVVKGSKSGTTTDASGNFRLSVPAGATTLVVSSVGFTSKEVAISDNISVTLETKNQSLNEVVVVGYGTRKVKDATGSLASITPKDFNKGQISTPEQLFQGRTPGVIVTPSSGEPGAASTINIRGTASIRSDQQPLYVVDGVPINNGSTSSTASGVEGSSTPKNPLMFLNPNDIESITILKDASSAAIYGSRGANGVILITTKSGKGAGGFQFGASTSIATIASRYDLLNSQDFLVGVKQANLDAGADPATAAAAVKTVDHGANTDWQDQIFRTGVSQNYNLAWGFGKKQTSLRLSGSYDDQQGIIENSSLKRLTGNANLSQKFLNDKLKFNANISYSNIKDEYPPQTNNAGYLGSLVGAALQFNPTNPVYNPDGSFYAPNDGNRNPVEMLTYFTDKDNINRFLTNLSLSYEILRELTYKVSFGYDDAKGERTSFADPRLTTFSIGNYTDAYGDPIDGSSVAGNGRTTKQNNDLKSILIEHTLSYNKYFQNGQNIDAVVGYSYQKVTGTQDKVIGWGLSTPVVGPNDQFNKNFDGFTNYYTDIPGYQRSEIQSFFGRVNYSINEKYFLTGTLRIDGSTKFGTNNKYGTFPAFAAKWRLIKEPFAQKLSNIFSDLSIRANYGILGSQEGLDAYANSYYYIDKDGNSKLKWYGNDNLKWEQAATTGAGVDFSLLNNRLSGTIDYFYTKRKDVLFFGPTPGGFAPSSFWFTNLPGFIINSGVEVGLNYTAIKSGKFSWNINYNMTFIHNDVQDLNQIVNTGGVSGQGLSGAYAQTIQDGYPIFTWKMPVFLGFDGNGDARYADGGKDQLLGSALPKFIAGLTNNFTLGRWSLSAFLNASTGFYVYNNTANALFLKGSLKTAHNVTYDVYNSPEDPINPGSVSSRFLEKGDFLRLSNVNLSYSFDMKKSKAVKSLSLYASGQNLALFTGYSGLDPEVNVDKSLGGYPSRGFDYAGYPKARTFTLGVNLGF